MFDYIKHVVPNDEGFTWGVSVSLYFGSYERSSVNPASVVLSDSKDRLVVMELSSVQSMLGTEVLRTTSELVSFGILVHRLYISYFHLFKLFEKYEVKKMLLWEF